MSTKNLARTVIEGGRSQWSKADRQSKNGTYRARERELLHRLRTATELEDLVAPKRPPRYRDFSDKLGPPRRWLGRQVGRPWSAVRADLFERFDPRSIAGRHIVFCHMLPWVEGDRRSFHRWREFTVDRHGILRRRPDDRPRQVGTHEPLGQREADVDRWLAGRRVTERGGAFFWLTPTAAGAYRQHHRLDDRDGAFWRSLPDWFRTRCDPLAHRIH